MQLKQSKTCSLPLSEWVSDSWLADFTDVTLVSEDHDSSDDHDEDEDDKIW